MSTFFFEISILAQCNDGKACVPENKLESKAIVTRSTTFVGTLMTNLRHHSLNSTLLGTVVGLISSICYHDTCIKANPGPKVKVIFSKSITQRKLT